MPFAVTKQGGRPGSVSTVIASFFHFDCACSGERRREYADQGHA